MAGKIRASDIEEVKARANIADIVGEYVQLKPSSVGSLKGLCPFHDEKSPSFNVRPSQGFYHCFGCGEGGDVYKFIQQMESLSFTDAVERLASRIGFTLTYEAGSNADTGSGVRNRVLEANQLAAEFFEQQLYTQEGAFARDFLKGRAFDKAAAERFNIGYSPKGWSNLTDFLKTKGFSIDELVTAGLAANSEKGGYDKFRGRLMWPIRDVGGATIGFGARKLYEDDNGPKYLNTSDTPVYHKSQVLYGIDLARKDITKGQQVVVVEGYTDVMACHLAGVTTAVATCGTAFGDDHIRILNRMLGNATTPAEVIFTFDPDAAGQKAAMRAFEDSHKFSAHTFVAIGPNGLDPSDLRQSQGDEAVRLMIEGKRPLFEFAIKQKLGLFNLDSLEGRVSATRAAAPVIAAIRDEALRPAYVRELAGWVNLPPDEVARITNEAIKQKRAADVAGMRTDRSQESTALQSDEASVSTAAGQDPEASAVESYPPVDLRDPINTVERQTLEVLIQCPQAFNQAQLQRIAKSGMSAPAHNAILSSLIPALSAEADTWLGRVEKVIPAALFNELRSIAARELPVANEAQLEAYATGVVRKAMERTLAREKAELLAKLRRTDAASMPEEHLLVQQQLVALENERRQLMEV